MADDEHASDTMHEPLGRAEFKSFAESTQEDWLKIAAANEIFKQSHVDRILTHLKLLIT